MDIVQLVIIVISFILTTVIVILSVQVWYILKEIRFSVHKMNKMLDDAGRVTEVVGDSAEGLSGFMNGIKTGMSIISSLKKGEKHE